MGMKRFGAKKKSSKGVKSTKKRKSNVWDDAKPIAKGKRAKTDLNPVNNDIKPKRRDSMMSQWRHKHKGGQLKQRKNEYWSSIDDKKQSQHEEYLNQRQKQLQLVQYGTKDDYHNTKSVQASVMNNKNVNALDSSSDEEDEEQITDSSNLFSQFVQTFQRQNHTPRESENEDLNSTDEMENDEAIEVENDEDIELQNETSDFSSNSDGDENVEKEDGDHDIEEDMENDNLDEDEKGDSDEPKLDTVENEDLGPNDPYQMIYQALDFTEENAKTLDSQRKQAKNSNARSPPESLSDGLYIRNVLKETSSLAPPRSTNLHIRPRLASHWRTMGMHPENLFATPKSIEQSFLQDVFAYRDIHFTAQSHGSNTEILRQICCMHILNHIFKSRNVVTSNTQKIAASKEDLELRDHGFARPTVLVLLPLRSSAYTFIQMLKSLLPASMKIIHHNDRFDDEYGTDEPISSSNTWEDVLKQGNNDDTFQIGISFARRSMRFFAPYHVADLIIASPLGLRTKLEEELYLTNEMQSESVRLCPDYLSSIELSIVDTATLIQMQNIEHLRTVFSLLNGKPKESPHTDFGRVKNSHLAFLSAYFRQTIVYAHTEEPIMNAIFSTWCKNINGFVQYGGTEKLMPPTITQVVPTVQQLFQRIDDDVPSKDINEARFNYFHTNVLLPLLDANPPPSHVLIVVPSYFDYVRLRNWFGTKDTRKLITCAQICEYTTPQLVSRARTSFFHGRVQVLLITERFYFYHHYYIRGITQLIFYALPSISEFYAHFVNMLGDTSSGQKEQNDEIMQEKKRALIMYSRYEKLRLQRIVGMKRAQKMIMKSSDKRTFLFC